MGQSGGTTAELYMEEVNTTRTVLPSLPFRQVTMVPLMTIRSVVATINQAIKT